MFRMIGRKTELIRYTVTYTEKERQKERQIVKNCISEEHKNEVEQKLASKGILFTTIAIDQTGNEWFEGLEFDSYDEALEVFNVGQSEYETNKQKQELVNDLKLRADIDYLAMMSGVEI